MRIILVLTTLALFSYNSFTQGSGRGIIDFSPFLGKWKTSFGAGFMFDEWRKVSDYTIEVRNYTYNPKFNDTIFNDFTLVSAMPDSIVLMPMEKKKDFPKMFKFVGIKDSTYTFKNDSISFPKMIEYKFVDKNKMNVYYSDGPQRKQLLIYYFERVLN